MHISPSRFIRLSLLILLFLIAGRAAALASTLYVSVASSMTDAIKEIGTSFESSHPDVKVRVNSASSGSLAKQITQGAPAHLFISANPAWMQYLIELNHISEHGEIASNRLVFVSARTKVPFENMEHLATLERVAMGHPDSVPVGQYAKQAMSHSGIYDTLRENGKLILAKNARQALLYADRGEVDGAIVYETDGLLARNAKILHYIKPELHETISYPAGLTKMGKKSDKALLLYGYLQSNDALAILEKHGFQPSK